jgi:cytochrome oxidase assembly protein ShyY1
VRFVDGWAALLEREDYTAAFAYTEHVPAMGWTPELVREVIKAYGAGRPDQKVTVEGVPSDVRQRKEVDRAKKDRNGRVGEIWYDLNIDGVASDLTATFDVILEESELRILLNDIHVM